MFNKKYSNLLAVCALLIFSSFFSQAYAEKSHVAMETSLGKIVIELYPSEAPKTVDNFIQYVNDKFYDGTIFHRVVPGFVVQGGGYTFDFQRKNTRKPIENEANNGLKNNIATLSMARTRAPNSATSQFFINTVNNPSLDPNPSSAGYAVFGKVIEGFDIVKKVEKQPRGIHRQYPEAPNDTVMIEKAYLMDFKKKVKPAAAIKEQKQKTAPVSPPKNVKEVK